MSEFNMLQLKKLCRIDVSPDEEEEIEKSLGRILAYVHKLNELDTKDVPPCRFVLKDVLKRHFREDEVKEVLPREQFLSNAPDQIGGMIRVPPVLK